MNKNQIKQDTKIMWYLVFLFVCFIILLGVMYPFLLKIDARINVLRLKGCVQFTIFNKFKIQIKFRIKNGYIYIYHKKKERKEKLTNQNINVVLILNIINQFYYRQQLLNINLTSNFGYNLNSCNTAVTSGVIDVVSKGILSKIKNNKKKAHIFVKVEPKYNQDIFNFRLIYEIRMSIVDIIYSLIYSLIKTWREYEKNRKYKFKQKQKN